MEVLPPVEPIYHGKSKDGESSLMVETYTILATSYDEYDECDDLSEHYCHGQMK